MDINIECSISLSKKIRSLIKNNESKIVLVSKDLKNGVGEGNLIISIQEGNVNDLELKNLIDKETSIQITPSFVKEDIHESESVSTIFSSTNISKKDLPPPMKKIAALEPPEKAERAHAIIAKEDIKTPEGLEVYDDIDFKKFVSNFDELMEEVNKAKSKKSDINLDDITNPRERAIAEEKKERLESIDIPAYIVNDTCGSIRVNDLNLNLSLNVPFDLSKISAKRISSSNDLPSLINSKMIKIIEPSEIESYTSKISESVQYGGLEVYSSPEEAESAMTGENVVRNHDDVERIDIDDNDFQTDQEKLSGLVNLTGNRLNKKTSSNPILNKQKASHNDKRTIRKKI